MLAAGLPSEAIAIASELERRIDLLLTDVIMPEMNGKELAGKLFESRPDLKCLYVSGYTANVIVKRGILADGLAFVQKPFAPTALLAKVRDVLDG